MISTMPLCFRVTPSSARNYAAETLIETAIPRCSREVVSLHRVILKWMGRRDYISVVMVACLAITLGQGSLLQAQQSLQAYLDSLTVGRHGSAIVINPATGEIRAAWNLRRATEDAYRPGSTAKIVAAAAPYSKPSAFTSPTHCRIGTLL